MYPLIALLFLTAVFAVFILWLQKAGNARDRNIRQITASMVRLRNRPRGAHFIVEDPEFGKHVQISGSVQEPLFFVLPCEGLTLDEYDRACQLFARRGHDGPETFAVFDPWSGSPAGTQTSFILPIGDDFEQIARFAQEVFSAVYRIDDRVVLKITEQ